MTTHPASLAFEYFRTTAATTPAPNRMRMAVPMISPTNMSPLLMAAPRPGPGRLGPGPHVQDAFPMAAPAGNRAVRAPPGPRDGRALPSHRPWGSGPRHTGPRRGVLECAGMCGDAD